MSGVAEVASVPALLAAVNGDVDRVIVKNGIYDVESNGIKVSTNRQSRPLVVEAESPFGVTFDGGGRPEWTALWFCAGAAHQRWSGFQFRNGTPKSTGVIVLGAEGAAVNNITLQQIRGFECRGSSGTGGRQDHFLYVSSGEHYGLTFEDFDVDGREPGQTRPGTGMCCAVHIYHAPGGRHMTFRRWNARNFCWTYLVGEKTAGPGILFEDCVCDNSSEYGFYYYLPSNGTTLRRVVTTRSGVRGYYAPVETGIDAQDCVFK